MCYKRGGRRRNAALLRAEVCRHCGALLDDFDWITSSVHGSKRPHFGSKDQDVMWNTYTSFAMAALR